MLQKTIPSYLYTEYNDDEDLQAFVRSYNSQTQGYIDYFNAMGLPIYTGTPIEGALLDWVLTGLYGIPRPVIPSGLSKDTGPFNSYALNSFAFNTLKITGPSNVYATSDDVYKRVATWALYKGDGKHFSIRWLKRRIIRFLEGLNGTDAGDNPTYQISVTFGTNRQVNIRILNGVRTVTGGALFNRFALNTIAFNSLRSSFAPLPGYELAPILQAAINAGVLELPFQFTYVVNI